MRKILMVGFVLLVSAAISSAVPVPCLTAAAAGSNVTTLTMGCTLGPLLFDMFAVVSAPAGTNIFLSTIGTVAANPNFSLGFQITTPAPPIDTIFTYRVSTLSGSPGISDVGNSHNGVNTTIGEIVCKTPFVSGICTPPANVLANFSNPGGGVVPQPVTATFAPQSQIFILKDISEPGANSFISSFVNNHSVPEPISWILMGSGLLVLGSLRRFRKE